MEWFKAGAQEKPDWPVYSSSNFGVHEVLTWWKYMGNTGIPASIGNSVDFSQFKAFKYYLSPQILNIF